MLSFIFVLIRRFLSLLNCFYTMHPIYKLLF